MAIFRLNMPDDLQERLRRHARENNSAMSTVMLTAVERELARSEWRTHLAQRPVADLGIDAAALLAGERARRDTEIG